MALLDKGAGGVPELRNAIDGYEEISPLYGFLHYRRRKVVISYMPQGLSRLVQGILLHLLLKLCLTPDPCSSCHCPVSIHSGQVLPPRYCLYSLPIVRTHGKRFVIGMPTPRRLRLHHLLLELPPPPQIDGNHRRCRGKYREQRRPKSTPGFGIIPQEEQPNV